jgi:hypothetical protein
MGIDSHLSTCVGTQSPKYLEMAQGHISLSECPSEAHEELVRYAFESLVITVLHLGIEVTEL